MIQFRVPSTDDPRVPAADTGAEWRWRNYTEHLSALGYDLYDGAPRDDAQRESVELDSDLHDIDSR